MKIIIALLAIIWANYNAAFGQHPPKRNKEKTFQLSFFPGISSNGLESGFYSNKFSINLFSGISAGNQHLEIGGIANINTGSSTGIQVAGLANILGSHTYYNLTMAEELELIENGFSVDLTGIQLSGLLNHVRNNVEGIQLTGGVNFNNGYVHGFQLAGLANMAGKQVFGVQIAGLFNLAVRGMNGSQVSLLYNYTDGGLSGIQLGAINRAVRMNGKNTSPVNVDHGFQVGLMNISKEMDGVQIGLLNITKKVHGTQLGLINVFKPSPYQGGSGNNYGTQVGLLNFGSSGKHLRLYADELFLTVIEQTTGNCQNCTYTPSQMPFEGRFKVVNQNALILAYNPWDGYNPEVTWGAGYGFLKVFYSKSSMIGADPRNGRWLASAGIRALHINRTKKFDERLSLLTKLHAEVGFRKKKGPRYFAGVSFNTYFHRSEDLKVSTELFAKGEKEVNIQYWPGYSIGLQF